MTDETPKPRIVRSSPADAAAKLRALQAAAPAGWPCFYGEDMDEVAPTAVCAPWLYPGCLTTMTGESSCGKSFLMARTEAAVLLGEAFPGPKPAQPCSVLHVDCDDRWAIGAKWQSLYEQLPGLREVAVEQQQFAGCRPPRASTPEQVLPGFIATAEQIAKARPHFRHAGALLVIDTFRTFMACEESKSEEIADFLSALREVITPAGPFPGGTVLICHHTGWLQADSEARERGTSAWRGNIDEALVVVNLRQERSRLEKHNLRQRRNGYRIELLPALVDERNLLTVTRMKGKMSPLDPLSPGALTFAIEPTPYDTPRGVKDGAWVVPCEVSASQIEEASMLHARLQRNDDDEAEVLAALAGGQVTSVRELVKVTGLSSRRAEMALIALRHAGKVDKPKHGGPYRVSAGDTSLPLS